MADRVQLHVGLMKSGTTFLQGQLADTRPRLLEQGVLFPGRTWSDQVRAVVDFMGYDARRTARTEGAWRRLKDEIDQHPGTALVSMEFLAAVRPPNIERFVAEFPDARVEVVVTLRDLGRNLPAMWQESLKNRYTWSWQDYLDEVRSGKGPAARHFWRQQAAARIVDKWATAVGRERTTLVTLPPKGAPRDLLWRRFCDAVGLGRADEWPLPAPANESLGAASSQVLRRLNTIVEGMPIPAYQSVVKDELGNQVLAGRKDSEQPIGFVVSPWVTDLADRMHRRLADSGIRIVGDLDDLTPLDVAGVDPDHADAEDVLDAAMVALGALVQRRAGAGPGAQRNR